MPADYPTGADLAAYLLEFGLTVTNTTILDELAAAGRDRFEGEVGRVMLAGESEARAFDPPADGMLDLEDDLAELESVTYQPQGGSEETLSSPTDYRALPQNAALRGKPYEFLQLRRRWWRPCSFDLLGAITVTGSWGYAAVIPSDAWLAMLAAGASAYFDQQSITAGGALTGWREGNSSASYAPEAMRAVKAQFLVDYPAAVARYTKATL